MKRIFKQKINFYTLVNLIDYYKTVRAKRSINGKERYGTYFYCSKADKNELSKFDNVLFFKAHSEFAPEQIKQLVFVFD